MNIDAIVVAVAAVCVLFAGFVVTNADNGEEPMKEIDPADTVFKWPSVTAGGELGMVECGDEGVTFSATSIDETKWTFQHWVGPDGLLDTDPVKTFPTSTAGYWTAVFSEVA